MQKLVKGATKPKATVPKAKYVEPILSTTFEAGHDFESVMDGLTKVIGTRNGSWPSIYKALIMVHIMIREGSEDVTLKYIGRHPRMFDIEDHVHRAPAMGRYARYLAIRGQQFKETKVDYVRYKSRQGYSRLHSLSIQKGLMRETGSVVIQLEALMKCQYQEQDIVNDDLLLMAFRLLVHDALSLFQVLNEGVINLLEHFFELTKPGAEEALDIYRGFRRLTSKVISYLRIAKDLEFKTMLHVPNIKHAPTSLVSSLEMYLNDPAFENNRRQYLAEKQAHEVKRTRSHTKGSTSRSGSPVQQTPRSVSAPQSQLPPPQTQHQGLLPENMMQTVQFSSQQAQQTQLPPQQPPQQTPAGSLPTQPLPNQTTGAFTQPQLLGDSNSSANPFWQSQQSAAQIQNADGQAQLQMQQLHQLQVEQLQQQESMRQRLEQQQLMLQQQQQQAQHQATQPQVQPYLESNVTGLDFGLQPAPNTQQIPQQQFPQQYVQSVPQYAAQPPQYEPQQAAQLQPQSTDYNPFKRTASQITVQPTVQSVSQPSALSQAATGTNPFKSPQTQFSAQFAALDNVGNQMQPSLIDFGQPQAYQTTGNNPFRA